MPPATSSVDSGGDESDSSDGPYSTRHVATPPAPDIREIVSAAAAAQDASSSDQASTVPGRDNEVTETATQGIMSSRAYQLEMLDQSLRQNVIVAMDTGSGKTQVAVLRIKAELERSSSEKIIWFLAPTVSLCAQQFEVIRLQVPSVNLKLLTGNDNINSWNPGTWVAFLQGVRIIVTTYQVLLDALCHAFVKLDQLSLIVFDEAHHCVDKHPGSKIMTDFYHRRDVQQAMPAILGLTATPSIRSKVKNIETLEATLNAKCISPTLHREELLKCVNKPSILHVPYDVQLFSPTTESMESLDRERHGLDITRDPYILSLRADPNDRNRRALERAIEKYDTYSQNQVNGLWSRCIKVAEQLGPWAADLYLWKAAGTYLDRLGKGDEFFDQWFSEEKRYVGDFLSRVAPRQPSPMPQHGDDVSNKVTVMLQELLSMEDPVTGIIFAKDRVIVMMLWELLVSSPRIVKKYNVGFVVGASNFQGRKKNLFEFLDQADQLALQKFRSGRINLLIATAVLEEGIDVPACNLVICFDNPETPKSFIQRRGRARMRNSRLILLSERSSSVIRQWEVLEEELKQVYQDEEREVRQLEILENSEETGATYFEVEATGARLDFDNAKQHLEHFCRILSQGEFVDSRPDYILRRHEETSPARLSATVLLPPTIPEALRRIDGQSTWLSEKNATKEVAFRAYVALYRAGLVNNNLLPFKFDNIPGVETRAAEVDVEPPFSPWQDVAREWHQRGQKWLYGVTFDDERYGRSEYDMLIPADLEQLHPMDLFLTHDKVCRIQFSSKRPLSEEEAARMPDHTSALLALIFAHRWAVDDRPHVVRISFRSSISRRQIGAARFDVRDERLRTGQYLIRDSSGTPFIYQGILPSRPPVEQVQHPFFDYELAPKDEQYLVLNRWTKRSDFLHRLHSDVNITATTKQYPWVLPQSCATADKIPAKHAQFGMMIPSIIHELEVMLTAKVLAETILQRVSISDLRLVREAISARSASEPVNYERLEFLGDSILKYCSSIQAASDHPTWPEGYLSFFRDRLIANSRLCRAALDKGLAKFILTRPFTGQKWRPLYLDNSLHQGGKPAKGRRLSTKTLADVVEALIGASYIDGGIPKAITCMSTFLGDCSWRDVERSREQLFRLQPDVPLPTVLEPLETLLGYSFQKKSLLVEAVTHGSYVVDSGQRSYERLEFLGDAVLDNLIVTRLFTIKPPLPHYQMHLLKTAMVNGDFLSFVVMEHGLRQREHLITRDLQVVDKDVALQLWKFMRHNSVAIGLEQDATVQRFESLRGDICATVEHGSRYPWALLARVQAKKFYSDLFEAIIGAVWVDSGSKESCEQVLARFGMLAYLDRIVKDKVHVQHPKEELGQWAMTQTVTYEVDMAENSGGEKTYLCKVHVGNRVVAEVNDGVSKEEAKTKAAEEAVKRLMSEKKSPSSEASSA
ncbi:Dicer-like protein 2 [Purpureocillium takamizusanense]|uniref:Dicer-like protein 2 n=1 Tax=Purpureocillium takamizusanense TaxID=2060973 RepID=A0A9Q8V8S8_9HYPO|nr:Dicer-like protein 2 [Purpureocillium takamizusanense]UNI16097.1 Dicer-like protein 2 [Purpureocillium takamizusanense]